MTLRMVLPPCPSLPVEPASALPAVLVSSFYGSELHTVNQPCQVRCTLCTLQCVLLPQVNSNLRIAKDTRRKQDLTALLEALLKLQQANNLQRALK